MFAGHWPQTDLFLLCLWHSGKIVLFIAWSSEEVPESIRKDDFEIVFEAVRRDATMFRFVTEAWANSKSMLMAAKQIPHEKTPPHDGVHSRAAYGWYCTVLSVPTLAAGPMSGG